MLNWKPEQEVYSSDVEVSEWIFFKKYIQV
jgi:hypothetical protein